MEILLSFKHRALAVAHLRHFKRRHTVGSMLARDGHLQNSSMEWHSQGCYWSAHNTSHDLAAHHDRPNVHDVAKDAGCSLRDHSVDHIPPTFLRCFIRDDPMDISQRRSPTKSSRQDNPLQLAIPIDIPRNTSCQPPILHPPVCHLTRAVYAFRLAAIDGSGRLKWNL